MKNISTQIGAGGQDALFDEILKDGDKKIRIRIRSGAYPFQSHAVAELWDGKQWHQVHSIHYDNMKTATELEFKKNLAASDFAADREELLRVVKEII